MAPMETELANLPPALQCQARGRPTWEIAHLFPEQGTWTEDDYFGLDGVSDLDRFLELSEGRLEVLPMPAEIHQFILLFILDLLRDYAKDRVPGLVLPSGVRVRLKSGRIRVPDIVYLKVENYHKRHQRFWDGADLVVEIVSGGSEDRQRDLETKVQEYAEASIAEYWIVDPKERLVKILTLDGTTYRVHGEFGPGQIATGALFRGLSVPVDQVLAPPGSIE